MPHPYSTSRYITTTAPKCSDERGAALILIVLIGAVVLFSYLLYNKSPTLLLAGNKQEVTASIFAENAYTWVRDFLNNGEPRTECRADNFLMFTRRLTEMSNLYSNRPGHTDLKYVKNTSSSCILEAIASKQLISSHLIKSFTIEVRQLNYNHNTLHKGIAIDVTVRLEKIQGLMDREFKNFRRSLLIRPMRLAEFALSFQGGASARIEVGQNARVEVHSPVFITADSDKTIELGQLSPDLRNNREPRILFLNKVYTPARVSIANIQNFSASHYRSIYKGGVVPSMFGNKHGQRYFRDIEKYFPEKSKGYEWAWNVPVLYNKDSSSYEIPLELPFATKNLIVGGPTRVNNLIQKIEGMGGIPEPPSNTNFMFRDENDTPNAVINTTCKNDKAPFIWISYQNDLELHPEVSYIDRHQQAFCGIIVAKTLTIQLPPDSGNNTEYAFFGIIHSNKLIVNGSGTLNIYNPYLETPFPRHEKDICTGSDPKSCEVNLETVRKALTNASKHFARNLFIPMLKGPPKEPRFQFIKNYKNLYVKNEKGRAYVLRADADPKKFDFDPNMLQDSCKDDCNGNHQDLYTIVEILPE